MLLVGACYSETIIPETAIVQFAIHVLVLIEDLPVRSCLPTRGSTVLIMLPSMSGIYRFHRSQ